MSKILFLFILFSSSLFAVEEALILSQDVQNITQKMEPLPNDTILVTEEISESIEAHEQLDESQNSILDFFKNLFSFGGNDSPKENAINPTVKSDTVGADNCLECESSNFKNSDDLQPYSVAFSVELGNGKVQKNQQSVWLYENGASIDEYLIKLKNTTNNEEINKVLSEAGTELNFADKIVFASKVGGLFAENYNESRDDTGEEVRIITLEQLLESARTKNTDLGGVCRDIATAQAKVLHEMGVKNTYVTTYAYAGGTHATVITQDPDDPTKIIKLNYSNLDTTSVSGTGALSQDSLMPEVGISYSIYDHNGKSITRLPTTVGTLLESQTGGVSTPFTEDNVINVATIKGNVLGDSDKSLSVQGFAASVEGNSKVYGVVANYDFGYEGESFKNKSRISVGGYQQDSDRSRVTTDAYAFYSRLQVDNSYPIYQDKTFQIEAVGDIDLQSVVGSSDVHTSDGTLVSPDGGGLVLDYALRGNFGISSTIKGEKATGTIALTQHAVIMPNDVREDNSLVPNLNFDHFEINLNSDYKINEEDLKVFIESTAVLGGLGNRGRAITGIKNDTSSLALGIEGATDSETPIWVPGAETKFSAKVDHQMKVQEKDIDLYLNFSHTETNSQTRGGIQFKF